MLNIFHNSNGAARCCLLHAVVLRCWFCMFFYYVSMLSIFHNSNGAARCCWLHAVVLRCWFCMFFYYVSMLSIFHNSNGAARCCWLHAVVLRCWSCMFFFIMYAIAYIFILDGTSHDNVRDPYEYIGIPVDITNSSTEIARNQSYNIRFNGVNLSDAKQVEIRLAIYENADRSRDHLCCNSWCENIHYCNAG